MSRYLIHHEAPGFEAIPEDVLQLERELELNRRQEARLKRQTFHQRTSNLTGGYIPPRTTDTKR